MFNGSEKMVTGSKEGDNKDPKNKQKTMASASAAGTIKASAGNTKLRPQNDGPVKPPGPDQGGDAGVKMQEKRQKKVVRSETLYTDKAIAAAKSRL